MRSLALPAALLLLTACAGGGDNAATSDTTKAATPAAATLADFAGTWQMTGRSEAGDSLLSYRLVVDSAGAGTITFADGRSVPARMTSLAGDSLQTEAGPYESALRRGVQVRTHSIFRRSGDGLSGVTHATYALPAGDSTMTIRHTGVRVP